MTRVRLDDPTWRSFHAAAIESGLEIPDLLASLIRGYLRRRALRRPVRSYERRS
jgi:hypothetical protein